MFFLNGGGRFFGMDFHDFNIASCASNVKQLLYIDGLMCILQLWESM